MKALILASVFLLSACNKEIKVQAQVKQPTPPVVETVPPPAAMETPPVSEGKEKSEVDQTDLGLIKTEKTIVDKSCKVINGQVKCKHQKKVKKKTI